MEIKIGIKNVSRELALDLDTNSEELKAQLTSAIKTQETIDLVDKRGAHTLVSGADIAYVEFSPEHQNRIGFAL
ncbi:DUF3107 domain-containing protein [Mobiluncus mulieris]|uniref:ATP-binding protein n=2 Tax=Mobiluncus mulieris TaxID=2052 RepID=E0QSR0_9ACTO|nr:DUF3107 domain-containing protein [Mobiluncus mulieris]EEJ53787.1 hypothetical protein HMPREF0577_1283 [Mobiluncus mulieris ATCC 35243]EEZ90969.1 hypothetical protein HMPREF0578_1972 [Mobiluncus mulieris 28-1]EFM45424.1 hypothetical protein HMPREF0580_1925 [Mobiluncus mulieris ATCC 35239]EFN94015.1 hypothetical protein HMPREF9278_0022 [Mobiluncus mulieris FB024-16]MBB5845668.1 hypothetical protein [Mobiluncus mulieris]